MLRRSSSSPSLRRQFIFPPAKKTASHAADSPAEQSISIPHSSPYTFVTLISAAAHSSFPADAAGEQYHSPVIKIGLISNLFVATALLGFYCKARNFNTARQLFDEMPSRNVITWNTLIHGLSQSDRPNFAACAFSEMLVSPIQPNPSTFSAILTAFSRSEDLAAGISLHCVGFKRGFFANVVVATALVNMYCKCSELAAAKRLFDEMPERNLVTWTSLITGYARHQRPAEAMRLVREMKLLGVEMNSVSYNSLLSSFCRFADLVNVKQVHSAVIKEGLDFDPYIAVSLVTMYSKYGRSEDFMNMSSYILDWDHVSFNSIIAGFSRIGNGWEVLAKFVEMRKMRVDADDFTFASVLRAIAIVAALPKGRQAHALILKSGHASSAIIQNGLVSMYAKCGDVDGSKAIFSSMEFPDLTSWNSLLSGCARHGSGEEALSLFEEMRGDGIKPDATTYLTVLSACGHVGLIKKGLDLFHLMKEADPPVVSSTQHYACVVDLLGRAGFLNEACVFIGSMPIMPGISVYRALLSACQIHGNVEIAEFAAKCLFELCPGDSGAHVLLSNVFAADKCWRNAARVRNLMYGKRTRKEPASSWC
ncbi:Pentatricopeptide repeat-containing protein [Platanthera zijinensis]|uniref:Pentatricopeptide repeat-containing protein n=1 Tax=Platanthera zijinensis TaxID=2320716 RepID=A0AAP0BL36_9ASPA